MVSPVTHAAGTFASKARSSISLASSGLVENSTSSGTPASARRSASFAQLFLGRYKARSTKPPPSQRHSRGTRRSGSSPSCPQYPSTVAEPQPTWSPSSGSRSRRQRAPPLVCEVLDHEVLDHVLAQVVAYQ